MKLVRQPNGRYLGDDGIDYVGLVGPKVDPDKPQVIKYDGLADGKGVFVTNNREEFILAVHAVHEIKRKKNESDTGRSRTGIT